VGGQGDTTTTTTTDASRNATQKVDFTNRDASVERNELTSYTTQVANILSPLSVHHLGSSYLRFSLWPLPITTPLLPNTDHYSRLADALRWRSSGLEGTQEFVAVALVPKGKSICLEAVLRTVSLVLPDTSFADDLPEFPDYDDDDLAMDSADYNLVIDYINRKFPPGTPIDALDIDTLDTLDVRLAEKDLRSLIRQGCVEGWAIFPYHTHNGPNADDFDAPQKHFVVFDGYGVLCEYDNGVPVQGFKPVRFQCIYKPLWMVWLEAWKEKQQKTLRELPVGTPLPLLKPLWVHACFEAPKGEATPQVNKFKAGSEALRLMEGLHRRLAHGKRDQTRPFAAIDAAIRAALDDRPTEKYPVLSRSHPEVLRFLAETLAELPREHPGNRDVDHAIEFGFSNEIVKWAKKVGIRDLRELGRALVHGPLVLKMAARRQALERTPFRQEPTERAPDHKPAAIDKRWHAPAEWTDMMKKIGR